MRPFGNQALFLSLAFSQDCIVYKLTVNARRGLAVVDIHIAVMAGIAIMAFTGVVIKVIKTHPYKKITRTLLTFSPFTKRLPQFCKAVVIK